LNFIDEFCLTKCQVQTDLTRQMIPGQVLFINFELTRCQV